MHKCPHCQKPSISTIRKLCLGPALATRCKQCNNKVGVSYSKSFIATIPLFVALALSISYNSPIPILIGFIITSIIYIKWVPLIKK